ncbi:MAG: inorganic pyrophosphatase [Erysipelotrichaceae bacterium]|nr:inorganic pyrophosphatase [Erysipelotrichaceae bacterium]
MVIIDRPLGSIHPKHKNIVYPVNYGYIPNRIGGDNEEQDAYVLALEDIPLKSYIGRLIGVIIRIDDNETKWIISNRDFSEKEILEKVSFQEKYFKSVLFK